MSPRQEESQQGDKSLEQAVVLMAILALGCRQVEQGKVVPLAQAIRQVKARRKANMESDRRA